MNASEHSLSFFVACGGVLNIKNQSNPLIYRDWTGFVMVWRAGLVFYPS